MGNTLTDFFGNKARNMAAGAAAFALTVLPNVGANSQTMAFNDNAQSVTAEADKPSNDGATAKFTKIQDNEGYVRDGGLVDARNFSEQNKKSLVLLLVGGSNVRDIAKDFAEFYNSLGIPTVAFCHQGHDKNSAASVTTFMRAEPFGSDIDGKTQFNSNEYLDYIKEVVSKYKNPNAPVGSQAFVRSDFSP